MSADTQNLKRAGGGNVAPQYYNPLTGQYEYAEGRDGGISVYGINRNYVGYSNETKPTAGVIKGDSFLELDTKDIYFYDGSSWVVF